jgi:hypothetical protein
MKLFLALFKRGCCLLYLKSFVAFGTVTYLAMLVSDALPLYFVSSLTVKSPPNCSDICGPTSIAISAPGMTSVTVKCWKPGPGFGSDAVVGTVKLDADGNGSLVFSPESFPHGPITLRMTGENSGFYSNCYLQLYNKKGVPWNEGLPLTSPPQAAGLSLVFADDFNKPLSISTSDPHSVYYDHKPGGGDFGEFHFASYDSPSHPFTQVDSYLRIRASAATRTDGLLSSIKKDGSGFEASIPCYFECRMLAPSAPGTWPAFWLMTNYMEDPILQVRGPADELDVVECYGGEGMHNPNSKGGYRVTSHFWNQGSAGKLQKGISEAVPLRQIGGGSSWWETFHTYGCKITDTDTIYYCDNIEVGRHPTGFMSKHHPFFFLVNLAVGGNGWPVNLSQCHGVADMYIDYIRVYQGAANSQAGKVAP